MKRIVFLDIDGVLNSTRNAHALRQKAFNPDGIDIVCLKLVEEVCKKSGASVVISSTWRLGRSEDWFRGLFDAYGVDINVVGMTPVIREFRGDEVKAWLDEQEGEFQYVCIDDGSDFYHTQPLVKTSHEIGFTHRDMEVALKALGCADDVEGAA